MSRARNIKPGFFTNADLLDCQPLARLLFAGLWCEADRRGILEDRPKTLKIKILPGDNCDVDELLNELAEKGFVVRYQVGDFRGLYLPNFGKHQNPHIKEMPSTLPAPDQNSVSTVQAPDEHDASPADSLLLIPDSPILIPLPDSSGSVEPLNEPIPAPIDPRKPQKRKTRLPDDWMPGDRQREVLAGYGFSPGEIDVEAVKFKNYHLHKGDSGLDWSRAFSNWMENSRTFSRPPNGNPKFDPRSITADHAGEDREYLKRGLPPVWGSKEGGIDHL